MIWCSENRTYDHRVTATWFVRSFLKARISNQMLIFERVLSGPKTLAGERWHTDLIWFHTLAVPPPGGWMRILTWPIYLEYNKGGNTYVPISLFFHSCISCPRNIFSQSSQVFCPTVQKTWLDCGPWTLDVDTSEVESWGAKTTLCQMTSHRLINWIGYNEFNSINSV